MPNDFNFDYGKIFSGYNNYNSNGYQVNPKKLSAEDDYSDILNQSSMNFMGSSYDDDGMEKTMQKIMMWSVLSSFLGPFGKLIGNLITGKLIKKQLEKEFGGEQAGKSDKSGTSGSSGTTSGNGATGKTGDGGNTEGAAGSSKGWDPIKDPVVPAWRNESVDPSTSAQKKANKKAGRDAFNVDYLSDATVDAANKLRTSPTSSWQETFWERVEESGVKDKYGNPAFSTDFLKNQLKDKTYNDSEKDAMRRFIDKPNEFKFFADENGLVSKEALDRGLYVNKYGTDGLAKAEADVTAKEKEKSDAIAKNKLEEEKKAAAEKADADAKIAAAATKAATEKEEKITARMNVYKTEYEEKVKKEAADKKEFNNAIETLFWSNNLAGNKDWDEDFDYEYLHAVMAGGIDSYTEPQKNAAKTLLDPKHKNRLAELDTNNSQEENDFESFRMGNLKNYRNTHLDNQEAEAKTELAAKGIKELTSAELRAKAIKELQEEGAISKN